MIKNSNTSNEFLRKYLDTEGLQIFLNKLKEYIEDRIALIYGDTIKLDKDADSTVTEKIEEILTTIGGKDEEGSIIERLESILSAYVKTINTDPNQKELLKINITEVEDNKGNYIIALEDNGFNDYITKDIVTKLRIYSGENEGDEIINGELNTNNSYVNVSIDNNTGNILLSVDEQGLIEIIEDIKGYTINGKTISNSPELTGSDIKVDTNDETTITEAIGDLNEGIETVKGYTVNDQKISDNPVLTGSDINVDAGDETTIAEAISDLNEDIETINSYEVNGQKISTEGGVLLKATDIKLESGLENSDFGSDTTVEEAIVANAESIIAIDNYEVNGQKISKKDGVVLGAEDIKLGADVADDDSDAASKITKDSSVLEAINKLFEKLQLVGKIVQIKEVHPGGADLTTIEGQNGDFIIVGQKEYVYWEDTGLGEIVGEDQTNWILMGDVSQILEELETFKSQYSTHKHGFSISYDDDNYVDESSFTGTTGTTEVTESLDEQASLITAANDLPTWDEVEVATSSHIHSVTTLPEGTVSSGFTGDEITHDHEFEGTTATTENTTLSISYETDTCTLTINTTHNHQYTPVGNITETTFTPSGTVNSEFSGTEKTYDTGASSSNDNINSINYAGSQVTFTNIELPGPQHTHNFTPSGTVEAKISYEGGETDTPNKIETETE